MNYNQQFCALAVLALLSISLIVVANEEVKEVVTMEEVVVTARKREQRSVEGGLRLAYLFPNADIEVALIGRNILNDTSPTGGIDFNNLTGYVNEPRFWSMELVRRF